MLVFRQALRDHGVESCGNTNKYVLCLLDRKSVVEDDGCGGVAGTCREDAQMSYQSL